MLHFEKVSRFNDEEITMPMRKTSNSAGYDFAVAEDIVIPPMDEQMGRLMHHAMNRENIHIGDVITLEEFAEMTKATKAKPTLVSTGVKCYMDARNYLELSVRSSTPLKYWLILANGVGIIDSDYVDNEDNEGEIFFQFINLSPFAIELKKGDIIGQGIIKPYLVTDDDSSTGGRRRGGFGSTSNPELELVFNG
jgi:dUTP pyrophosphatase